MTSLSEIWGDQMTPEARFSARVKAGLVNCSIERIENRVNLGIPDMLVGVACPPRRSARNGQCKGQGQMSRVPVSSETHAAALK